MLSREIAIPSISASFSAAKVGPKPAYLPRKSPSILSRTLALSRRSETRPRWSATGIEKRQVFDLAERPLMVTEHQASIYRCENCRGVTKAAFPDGVVTAAQYGERVKAAAVYLNIQQLIPEDRTAQALSDLFGAPLICSASIVAWVGKKAQE